MTEAAIRLMMASVALSTTMSVFLHDSHLDVATITALSKYDLGEKDASATKLSPDLHTHSEHMKMKKSGRHTLSDPRDLLKNRHKKMSPKLTKSGSPAHVQFD